MTIIVKDKNRKKSNMRTFHLLFTIPSLPFTINIEMVIEAQIIKINPEFVELDKIRMIVQVLREEGIIVYPTDTFYGLGANCFSKNAIQKIYKIKERRPSKPLSILISDMDMMQKIAVDIPSLFWQLADEFWPGPLTIILKASSGLPKDLLGDADSIGVRLPAIIWLRELVREAEFPITATSANISGEREMGLPEEVVEVFCDKVDLVVDGGKTKGILPSAVVDLTSQRPKILREGTILLPLLKRYLER